MQQISFNKLPEEVKTDIIENVYDNSKFLQRNWNIWSFKEFLENIEPPIKIDIKDSNVDKLYHDFLQSKRKISEINFKKLLDIFKKEGKLYPILVNNNKFYDGGHRLSVYKFLKLKTIPTIDITNLLNLDWEKYLDGEIEM